MRNDDKRGGDKAMQQGGGHRGHERAAGVERMCAPITYPEPQLWQVFRAENARLRTWTIVHTSAIHQILGSVRQQAPKAANKSSHTSSEKNEKTKQVEERGTHNERQQRNDGINQASIQRKNYQVGTVWGVCFVWVGSPR